MYVHKHFTLYKSIKKLYTYSMKSTSIDKRLISKLTHKLIHINLLVCHKGHIIEKYCCRQYYVYV